MFVVTLTNVANNTYSFLTQRCRWTAEYPDAAKFETREAAAKAVRGLAALGNDMSGTEIEEVQS